MSNPSSSRPSWLQSWKSLLSAPPARLEDYPDHLQSPTVERRKLPSAWPILITLLVFALIPRVLMMPRINVVCSDGAYYISLAKALERGDISQALNMQFNVFPVILATLHRLGFEWELAAKVWGVALATLAVLPLFGWVRRMADDRVAAVACALYAIHPELIEWSPEMVREPTFWFGFTMSLYLIWRAVTEVRLSYFLAASVAITFSALTRFEGLFLLVALAGWGWFRFRALGEQRGRLVLGVVGCPLVLPALLLMLNAVWLHHDSSLGLLRLEPLRRVEQWVASFSNGATFGPEARNVTVATPGAPTPEHLPPAPTQLEASASITWMFLHTMERGLTPFFGLFLIYGYLVWRPVFHRRDFLPPFLISLLVCGGIWVHLWYTNQTSSRYVMSIVLLSMRCAAMGLIHFSQLVGKLNVLPSFAPSLRRPVPVLISTLAVLTVIGWVDAISTEFRSRVQSAELGRWIREHYGEMRWICGAEEQLPIICYHAHASYNEPPAGLSGESLVDFVATQKPEMILIGRGAHRAKDFTQLIKKGKQIGFEQVDPKLLPEPVDRVIVLSRLPMLR